MATLNFSLLSKTLTPKSPNPISKPSSFITSNLPFISSQSLKPVFTRTIPNSNRVRSQQTKAEVYGDYSSRRSSSSEPRETIMLPGCDYNHWLIVMVLPKDPALTREQMIETYLNTLATVLGRPRSQSPLFLQYTLMLLHLNIMSHNKLHKVVKIMED